MRRRSSLDNPKWTNEVGCVTCHATLSYISSRPARKDGAGLVMDELRDFMEYRVAHWDTDKLRQYLAKTPPPSLHHACWLMWAEAKLGGVLARESREQIVKELEKLQRPDGGRSLPSLGGWTGHDGLPIDQAPSDGYGTGLVVFAVRQADVPAGHEMVRKGVQWLKSNQRESGSWFTGSLGESYHLNFISHSATAFAVMALDA